MRLELFSQEAVSAALDRVAPCRPGPAQEMLPACAALEQAFADLQDVTAMELQKAGQAVALLKHLGLAS